MHRKMGHFVRWIMLVASGGFLLQAVGCDLVLQFLQTGLLGALTGIGYYLARNV